MLHVARSRFSLTTQSLARRPCSALLCLSTASTRIRYCIAKSTPLSGDTAQRYVGNDTQVRRRKACSVPLPPSDPAGEGTAWLPISSSCLVLHIVRGRQTKRQDGGSAANRSVSFPLPGDVLLGVQYGTFLPFAPSGDLLQVTASPQRVRSAGPSQITMTRKARDLGQYRLMLS